MLLRSRSLAFATIVRAVCGEARAMGLVVPAYRSPPRLEGADRTVCRRNGALIVAVRTAGRPFADVVADVVEGVLFVNGIPQRRGVLVRRRLVHAVEVELERAA